MKKIPERLYPYLTEFYKMQAEGNELAGDMYARKHEHKLEYESVEMFKVTRSRKLSFGTDKKVHRINEREK